jgi:hypothetical protein
MRHISASGLVLLAMVWAGCESDSEQEESPAGLSFPHTVTIKAERALVAATGEILPNPDFLRGDLVTFSSASVKVQTGCPKNILSCRPLHLCRLAPGSKPTKFTSLTDVCMDLPEGETSSSITNLEEGTGFVVQLNTRKGTARFWVKKVQGTGKAATATLEYEILD